MGAIMTSKELRDKIANIAWGVDRHAGDLSIADEIINTVLDYVQKEVIETFKDVFYVKSKELMGWKEQTDFYCKAREDLRKEQRTIIAKLRQGK